MQGSSRTQRWFVGLCVLGIALPKVSRPANSVWALGLHGKGQLCSRSDTPSSVPVAVAGGDYHSKKPVPPNRDPRVSDAYGRLPLSFEANRGQADRRVKFLARGNGYTVFLTSTEAVLKLQSTEGGTGNRDGAHQESLIKSIESSVLHMKLVGSNQKPQVAGLEELPGRVNYFKGNDPRKWRTNIRTYARAGFKNVYPGVDLVYYGSSSGVTGQKHLEYDFVIAPGANPRNIRLAFDGADQIKKDPRGNLVFCAGGESVVLQKPFIYQEIGGVRKEVAGRFLLDPRSPIENRESRRVGFCVSAYDATRPLIIDPTLVYSTYLGGSSIAGEAGYGIAADASGSAYVTGFTYSTDFPTADPVQPGNGSGSDAFVTKFNADGSGLVYSTYLGGNSTDVGYGIAVDASGNAYVTGESVSTDFPTANAFQPTMDGPAAFVTKLSATGSALVYSTYLGALPSFYHNGQAQGRGIAVDSAGNAYVTGQAFGGPNLKPDGDYEYLFPFVNNLPVDINSNINLNGSFVTKYSPTGGMLYSTILGGSAGSGFDWANGVAVDASGNAYVTGRTLSANFPTTVGAFQATPQGGGGGFDAFVAKIDTNASGAASLVYSTFLGGATDSDGGNAIAVDSSGNACVTGWTWSSDFPTTPGAFQTVLSGSDTVFVTKLNAAGSALVYSTLLGGSSGGGVVKGDNEAGQGIAVDSSGNAYVTGRAASDFPTVSPLQATLAYGGAFVTKLNSAGSALEYSTVLGDGDHGLGIALDASGNAYVTGASIGNIPTTPGAFQTTNNGSDGFVSKIADASTTPTVDFTSSSQVSASESGTMPITAQLSTVSAQDVTVPFTVSGTATEGTDYTITGSPITIPAGQYTGTITITVNDDGLDEGDETIVVALGTPTNAVLGATTVHTATIADDDPTPSLSINDVSIPEGNAGTSNASFTVSLSAASGKTVTVDYATMDDSAMAGSDYVATSGTLTLNPGDISKTVSVTANGDVLNEVDEMFHVHLSNAVNATLADGQGIGTILDDDSPPTISINDIAVNPEGDSGTKSAVFTVSLSGPSGNAVTVDYATADGTATVINDYAQATGTVTFSPGDTSKPVTVTTKTDTLDEDNETFTVGLSNAANATIGDAQGVGTIVDDDAAPTISINDVTVSEGNSGTKTATLTVSLSAASAKTATVNYATANGTATSGSDYTAKSGTLTFNPGITTQSVSVDVSGDATFEADETFLVNLSSAANATIADGTGQGTISNDDPEPRRPDALIRNSSETSYLGDGVYNTDGTSQTKTQTSLNTASSSEAEYAIKIQNDGTGSDSFKVTGTKAPTGWTVNYFSATKAGSNITPQVTGAGWPTGTLAVGGSKEIRVEVKPRTTTAAGTVLNVLVTATSSADTSKKDTVKATTTATAPPVYKPDLWIRNSTDASSIGDNIYATNGINETKTQSVTKGTTATYVLTVQNDGDTTDSFKITGTGGGAGWIVKYFDAASGGNEKTSTVTGIGWTVGPLAPGATSEYRVEVTPGSSVSVSASKVVLITATSVGDKTKKDTVKATTTAKKSTSSLYGDPRQAGDTDPEVRWLQAPPATMAAGMNYAVSWEVVGGKAVSHTYVAMSTDSEPTKKPLAMTEIQSGKPGLFKAWVTAPSKGYLYYQAIAIVDGKMIASGVVYAAVGR